VLFEVLDSPDEPLFSRLQSMRAKGQTCLLVRALGLDRNVIRRTAVGADVAARGGDQTVVEMLERVGVSPDQFNNGLQPALRTESVKRVSGSRGEVILDPIPPVQSLFIFGGGHVARFVSRIASTAGFAVTVVDDRAEFASPGRFPDATRTQAVPFTEAFEQFQIGPSTSIVIVTRGHRLDREILELAVRTPARYIGMIGSAKKVASTFAALRDAGVPLDLLKRVHAPIGLNIGAVTAEEIAVSIVAEMIRVRRGVEGPSAPMSWGMRTWFQREMER
jgi:xanthine dehydrogenase accessory factor